MAKHQRVASDLHKRIRTISIALVKKYINARLLPPAFGQKCLDCGTSKQLVYDHRDYWDALKVAPVCGSCNHRRGYVPIPVLDPDTLEVRTA